MATATASGMLKPPPMKTTAIKGRIDMNRTHYARAALATFAALALVVAVSACGGGGSSGAAPTTTATATPTAAATPQQPETLQSRFIATVKAVSPSVVEVQTPVGLGSGVVLDSKGDVVTNNHVVGTYTRFVVTDSTGKTHPAKLVGKFVPDDLAVIQVTGLHLPPLAFDNSSRLQVGDIVLAVGNPLGLQSSVTQGIVSALGRTVTEQNGSALADVIQTSAPINPGNSGGALVDLEARVVGIPTLSAVDNENAQLANGIGFAIPSNTVKAIADQLIRYGHVVNSGRAYLGVRLATLISGRVEVVTVAAKGPAASAGIVAGDTIDAIDGEAVQSADDIATTLADLHPGGKVKVNVRTPGGKSKSVTVTLGQYPGS
jgi:putative serine protease PepD